MSDVFISYAREDKPHAAALAKVLAARGWSVWWDSSIPPGKEYDEVIQGALNAAGCVVVLWSRQAADSRWVRAEAEEGANREILVPALIEDTIIPLAFRRIHAAGLVDWDGHSTHPGVSQLIETIAGILGRAPSPVDQATRKAPDHAQRVSLLLFLPTILVGFGVALLMVWRMPTRVQVEVTVDRAQFRIGPAQAHFVSVLDPAEFRSLTVEKFATIDFDPQTLEVADQDATDLNVQIPEAAWKTVAVKSRRVSLTAGEDRLYPAATFEAAGAPSTVAGRLASVKAPPGSGVTLERQGIKARGITVKLEGPRPRAVVAIPTLIHIFADHSTIAGGTMPAPETPSSVYRTTLRPDNPLIEVSGGPDSLVISLSFAVERATRLLSEVDVPVSALDFTQLDEAGTRVSSVRAEGAIRYPGYPAIESISLQPRTFIGLDDLESFYLTGVTSASDGLQLRLHGIAGHVMTRTGDAQTDHRLTRFDALWNRPRLAILLVLSFWALPTIVGFFRSFSQRNRL